MLCCKYTFECLSNSIVFYLKPTLSKKFDHLSNLLFRRLYCIQGSLDALKL